MRLQAMMLAGCIHAVFLCVFVSVCVCVCVYVCVNAWDKSETDMHAHTHKRMYRCVQHFNIISNILLYTFRESDVNAMIDDILEDYKPAKVRYVT